MASPAEGGTEIDDSLYSRQRYVLGDQAMKRMASSNVLISGLNGLGVEIAKNVVLAGIRQLSIHDDQLCTLYDLNSQFYLTNESLGKNRALETLPHLRELNPYVTIQQLTEEECNWNADDMSFLSTYQCVVLVGHTLARQRRVNDYCHAQGISFISCDMRGILTWAFVDNGDEFQVNDPNGETLSEVMIAQISASSPAVVSCLEHRLHGLETGDHVVFSDVKGCEELNGQEYPVTVIDPRQFSIPVDTQPMGAFVPGNATATQVKTSITVKSQPLSEALENPKIADCDLAKFGFPQQWHVLTQALYQYEEQTKSSPRPWNQEDAKKLLALAESLNAEAGDSLRLDAIDARLANALAHTAQGHVPCLAAFMGGIMGQEVIKSLSGKFTPLQQWLYLDAIEILPRGDTASSTFQENVALRNDRYDPLRICVGQETVERLASTKLFMVGAGAIGCEMMKNFALLGTGRGASDGCIYLTDNDLIEKSNLNRQFLFRPKDIQSPKSTTAAAAAKQMNSELRVEAMLDKVGPQTQNKFNNTFLRGLDLCVNALDNIEARLYMDQRIVDTQRPLLESGTLGPKGHVQVVVPYQSESYGSQSDPKSNEIPFCTLKSFPNSVDHCTIWARDLVFEENLVTKPRDLRLFLETEDLEQRLHDNDTDLTRCLANVSWLVRRRPASYADCVSFARLYFEDQFHNEILQLLKKFPLDHKLEDGSLFWAAPRRAPSPVKFDINDHLHYSFLENMARLWAQVWCLPGPFPEVEEIIKMCEEVDVPDFEPRDDVEIETDEKAEKPKGKETVVEDNELESMKKVALDAIRTGTVAVQPLEFEKDDDSNHHIDLIAAVTNLRARCYGIKEAQRLEIKRIAGNIMPAIATTTSAVAGLVALELIKLRMLEDGKPLPLDQYKSAFLNLAISLYNLSEPGPVDVKRLTDDLSVTMWDQWEVRGSEETTLKQFFSRLKKAYGLTPVGVVQGTTMVYLPMPMHKKKLDRPVVSLLKETENRKYDAIVTFVNAKGENVEGVPSVRFRLRDPKEPRTARGSSKKRSSSKKSSSPKTSSSKSKGSETPEKERKKKKKRSSSSSADASPTTKKKRRSSRT